MSLPKPGDHITAKCGRCSDITGHIVMLVLDGAVAKVECRACGSVHKYRETKLRPEGRKKTLPSVRKVRAGEGREQAAYVDAPPSRAAAKSSGARRSTTGKKREAWQEAMVRHNADTPKPYSMQEGYAPRDYILHPVFGRGEVVSLGAGKMEVLFEEGLKILRCRM